MANTTLNSLLKDYEQKKYKAELLCEAKKSKFYDSNPKLAEINAKLGNVAISISKAVLQNNPELEHKLSLDADSLKKEKELLLKSIVVPERYF